MFVEDSCDGMGSIRIVSLLMNSDSNDWIRSSLCLVQGVIWYVGSWGEQGRKLGAHCLPEGSLIQAQARHLCRFLLHTL